MNVTDFSATTRSKEQGIEFHGWPFGILFSWVPVSAKGEKVRYNGAGKRAIRCPVTHGTQEQIIFLTTHETANSKTRQL
jgi:hypothetical protein